MAEGSARPRRSAARDVERRAARRAAAAAAANRVVHRASAAATAILPLIRKKRDRPSIAGKAGGARPKRPRIPTQ